jgi:hypothetical protein
MWICRLCDVILIWLLIPWLDGVGVRGEGYWEKGGSKEVMDCRLLDRLWYWIGFGTATEIMMRASPWSTSLLLKAHKTCELSLLVENRVSQNCPLSRTL